MSEGKPIIPPVEIESDGQAIREALEKVWLLWDLNGDA